MGNVEIREMKLSNVRIPWYSMEIPSSLATGKYHRLKHINIDDYRICNFLGHDAGPAGGAE